MPNLQRRLICTALFIFSLAGGLYAHAEAERVWLDIPGTSLHVASGEFALITAVRVPVIQVHLLRQPNEVAYGKITTWVNAASANIVTTQRATDEGIICSLDLSSNAGLMLHAGRNSVEVTYKDRWNELHYASFILQLPLDKSHTVPQASTAAPYRGGRRFAVVVGVAKYKLGGRGVENIAYADQDAGAIRKELVAPHGGNVPEENVRFLLNEDATADNLRRALQSISSEAKADDVIFVYLNMNGSYDPLDPDRKYLLAYDSDPENLRHTAIAVSSLPGLLSAGDGSQHVVVLADTCHGKTSGGDIPDKVTATNLSNLYLARAFAVAGQAAMEAADMQQISHAGPQWNGSGAFTHFVVEGLEGAADSNHDGTVTTQELFRYVQLKVSEATMDSQVPMISVGQAGDVAMAGVGTAHRAH